MSSLIWTRTIEISGVPTDADSTPVLTDKAGTFGIKRLDTAAVVVAAGAAMTREGAGVYSYELAAPADGVTYRAAFRFVVRGRNYYAAEEQTASIETVLPSYLTASEADALAASLPGLVSYRAAAADAKATALALASGKLDAAHRWQGRKYDDAQSLEFPRLAYESGAAIGAASRVAYDPARQRTVAGVVWDWDADADAAVVPVQVKLACLYEADSIIDGTRDELVDKQRDGLLSQSVGGMSETYAQLSATAAASNALCAKASAFVQRFRLRSGVIR
jgi:hypothetical protein